MITKKQFGIADDGTVVDIYTLSNGVAEVSIITYGGAIQSIKVPNNAGKLVDVCCGYDTLYAYQHTGGYLGALIGRFGNRIRAGKFIVNGVEYQVPCNEAKGSLHGGPKGLDKKVWDAKIDGDELVLTVSSPDGDMGYPGKMDVTVKYSFNSDNELKLEYFATCDKDCPINLTNHCYFNLHGQGAGTIADTVLTLNADYITPVDEASLPDGRFMIVAGTPFDFRTPKEIGRDINADFEQIKFGKGYDHNYVLNIKGFAKFGTAVSKRTGIKMDCYTDQPGVQFYSGNFMNNVKGKDGLIYNRRDAFCLETQNYPNAVNCPEYPNSILKAGEEYHTVTVYKFSVE